MMRRPKVGVLGGTFDPDSSSAISPWLARLSADLGLDHGPVHPFGPPSTPT
jgi:hypothetical protein